MDGRVIRSVLLITVVALLSLLPGAAMADGMVIPTQAFAIPQIPDQRALIHYLNGTETLVIETSFKGQGTNFAWVVPLPADSKIQTVSSGLFPTLQTIFQPAVVVSVKHYWLALPIAALLIWLANVIRRYVEHALAVALSLLALAVFIAPLLPPTVSRAGGPESRVTNVRVLSRQNAGLFDTIIVKSTEPTALLNWLNEHGFATPTNIAPVIAEYVRDGWVFAAARLHCLDGESATQATHPLAFTFKTEKPVYPLRLTALGSDTCRIDLYVFGPSRAAAEGFSVEHCEAPTEVIKGGLRLKAGELHIRHKELASLVGGSPVATKLSATLNSRQMARDAYIDWKSYWPTGQKVYTKNAALTLSGNASAFVFAVLVLVWLALSSVGWTSQLQSKQWRRWIVPATLAAGITIYSLWLPKIEPSSLKMSRLPPGWVHGASFALSSLIQEELQNTNAIASEIEYARPLSSGELQGLLREMAKYGSEYASEYAKYNNPLTNCFTGEPIRFEASPGNLVLRPASSVGLIANGVFEPTANAYELVWHDLDGAEANTNFVVLHPWPTRF